MGKRRLSRVAELKGEGSNLRQSEGEFADKLGLIDVKDGYGEHRSIVEDAVNAKTVGEGSDVELCKESGLGRTDFHTLLDEVDGVGDLDLTLNDLGWDLKDLEERGLSRIASGGASRDDNINGGECTDTSRSWDSVGKNHVADLQYS